MREGWALTVAMPVFWLWPTPPSTARTMRMYSDLISRSSREVVVISPAGERGAGERVWVGQGEIGEGGKSKERRRERGENRGRESMKERCWDDQMSWQCACIFAGGGEMVLTKGGESTHTLGTGTPKLGNVTP